LAFVIIPADPTGRWMALGAALVAVGEALRLWAVRHIGVISRTRSDRLGPLVESGPFAYLRNPLYLGNIALWLGFTVSAGLLWLAPAIAVLLALEYHAIVRWEEALLIARRGEAYLDYASRVPRWNFAARLGSWGRQTSARADRAASPVASRDASAAFGWRDTLFSERGTLAAIAGAYLLLWLKV
jgi:hypothetical protein